MVSWFLRIRLFGIPIVVNRWESLMHLVTFRLMVLPIRLIRTTGIVQCSWNGWKKRNGTRVDKEIVYFCTKRDDENWRCFEKFMRTNRIGANTQPSADDGVKVCTRRAWQRSEWSALCALHANGAYRQRHRSNIYGLTMLAFVRCARYDDTLWKIAWYLVEIAEDGGAMPTPGPRALPTVFAIEIVTKKGKSGKTICTVERWQMQPRPCTVFTLFCDWIVCTSFVVVFGTIAVFPWSNIHATRQKWMTSLYEYRWNATE